METVNWHNWTTCLSTLKPFIYTHKLILCMSRFKNWPSYIHCSWKYPNLSDLLIDISITNHKSKKSLKLSLLTGQRLAIDLVKKYWHLLRYVPLLLEMLWTTLLTKLYHLTRMKTFISESVNNIVSVTTTLKSLSHLPELTIVT